MNALHFIPNFRASRFSFDEILEAASRHIKTLSDAKQQMLKEDLENGLANLTSMDQLQMYLSSYGDIHRQKLLMAYKHIPNKVWSEVELAVIDYGCGQCVAEMVLSDFMKEHYIDNDIISQFIIYTSKNDRDAPAIEEHSSPCQGQNDYLECSSCRMRHHGSACLTCRHLPFWH